MSRYYKLAFTTFRIIGSLSIIYSLLSCGYVLISVRIINQAAAEIGDTAIPGTRVVLARLLPAFFYLVLGILFFALGKPLAKLAVKGIDRE